MVDRNYNLQQLSIQEEESAKKMFWTFFYVTLVFAVLVFIVFFPKEAHSQTVPIVVNGYSNMQICNAIYKAEGGSHAIYKYGIRSCKYSSEADARAICFRTIKHIKRRYYDHGYREYPSFIQYLGSIYCPTTGRNLSKSEKRLNSNWVKNVFFYLNKEK